MESGESPQTHQMTSAFELFEPSIKAIGLNLVTLLLLFLSGIAVLLVPALLLIAAAGVINSGGGTGDSPALIIAAIIVGFVSLAAAAVLFSSIVSVGLRSVRNQKVKFNEAVELGKRYVLRLVGLAFATGLIILAGLILLLVPGIFMYKRYLLAPYYVVDKDIGVFEAMRQSAADSKKFSGPVWGVAGVNILLGVAGIIPIVGLFVSIAQLLYSFAPAKRYDEIQKAHGHKTRSPAAAS